MKKIIGYFLILFLVNALGCSSSQKVPATAAKPTEAERRPHPLTVSDELDKRIQFLNALLSEKDLSGDDNITATTLRDTYQALQGLASSRRPTETDYSNVIQDLFRCLSTMDKKYFAMQKGTVKKEMLENYSSAIIFFAKKRRTILDSYLSGDFQGVIDSCIELKKSFGPDSLTPDIGLLFSLSLAKKGMLEEAITVGEGVAKELETGPDIIQLKSGIAEWYSQQGQRENAIAAYEKLADTMDEKGINLQSLSRKISVPEKEGGEVGPILDESQPQDMEEAKTAPLLQEVEKLLEQNRFSETRDLLFTEENRELSPPEKKAINQALKRLELAEENYLEKKISTISKKVDIEQARSLLAEERYEKVISTLEATEPEQEDSPEIKELKLFATEKLINRERNRAAKIFLAGKETQDPLKKEKCFRESLKILNALVENYPNSHLSDKLTSHIKKVEEELDKLKNNIETGSE